MAATLPDLGFSYGDNISANFTSGQVSVRIGQVGASGILSYIIEGRNSGCTLHIEIKTDSLRAGTYNIDGSNGSVAVYDGWGSQIGYLAGQYFQLSISYNERKALMGNFYGGLQNPLTGWTNQIDGYFINL